jgi:hypothetical protein
MDQVLYGNVFDNIIIEHLSLRDIYSLRFVNSIFRKRINKELIIKIIKIRIERKLQDILGPHYDQFVENMIENKAILSGSFILQCILDEEWYSDIDIYVDLKHRLNLHKGMKKMSYSFGEDEYVRYKTALKNIDEITNYYVSNDEDTDGYDIKIQVITIRTSEKYSLIDHINNTGFDVCKNRLTYNDDGNLQLYLENYKEAITKTSTFTIQDVDDFYFRIQKYSNRGFYFKPRYNRLLCVEYLFYRGNMGPDIICGEAQVKCDKENCPIKIFFNNVEHFHSPHQIIIDTGSWEYLVNLLPQLISCDSIQRLNLKKAIWKCIDIDDYAKIRNQFAQVPIDIYNSSNIYDIRVTNTRLTYN